MTATWLFDTMRREFPTLSLGNVYRNLQILVDHGFVNRLRLNTYDVFEARREPHYHFVCDACGSIDDIEVPKELQTQLERDVIESRGHLVNPDKVEFHGLCAHCRMAGRTLESSLRRAVR